MSSLRNCESCGEVIDGAGNFGWDGKWYCSTEHMPLREPPPCSAMVVHALQLLSDRATIQNREHITTDDIAWAIQELER